MEENAKSEEESFKTPGERIVKLCEKQQISQRELARRIGVTSSQISRILKGETKTINSDMLMALAQEFGVSTDYILGIVNNPENTQSVENTENLAAESKDMEERREQPFHTPMLLMSSAFPLGGCIDFIESLADQDEKMMAYAEYYYFSGHSIVLYGAVLYVWYMLSNTVKYVSRGRISIGMKYRPVYGKIAVVLLVVNTIWKNGNLLLFHKGL